MNELPKQLDSERYVLGVAMKFPSFAQGFETLPAEAYYDPNNAQTAQAILTLKSKSLPVDPVTVKDELRRTKRDVNPDHLIDCTESVGGPNNFQYHLDLVREASYGRQMIQRMDTARNAILSGGDIPEQIAAMETLFAQMFQGMNPREEKHMREVVRNFQERLTLIDQSENGLIGIPTGNAELDASTRGWQNGKMYIVAARPKMGKSDFAIYTGRAGSMAGYPMAYISLEMEDFECMERAIAMAGKTPKQQIISKDVDTRSSVLREAAVIEASGFRIIDIGSSDISRLKHLCKKLVMQGVKAIIIDYLQLLNTPGKNRDTEIGKITRALKMEIARDLNIPVILLSQLNRSVETRGGNKRPIPSDLRESGNIEQDLDFLLFLYRPEYYGLLEDDEGNSTKNVCELIVALNRTGPVKTIKTVYQREYGIFRPYGYVENGVPF